jgi:hypothetical protein
MSTAAAGGRCEAALSIAYGADLRGGEVVMLRVADIDNKRVLIRVEVGEDCKDREPGQGTTATLLLPRDAGAVPHHRRGCRELGAHRAAAGAVRRRQGLHGPDDHDASSRAAGPFTIIDCAALPSDLLDRRAHLLTGLSGLISRAVRSLICSTVRMPLVPKRGISEQGKAAWPL